MFENNSSHAIKWAIQTSLRGWQWTGLPLGPCVGMAGSALLLSSADKYKPGSGFLLYAGAILFFIGVGVWLTLSYAPEPTPWSKNDRGQHSILGLIVVFGIVNGVLHLLKYIRRFSLWVAWAASISVSMGTWAFFSMKQEPAVLAWAGFFWTLVLAVSMMPDRSQEPGENSAIAVVSAIAGGNL